MGKGSALHHRWAPDITTQREGRKMGGKQIYRKLATGVFQRGNSIQIAWGTHAGNTNEIVTGLSPYNKRDIQKAIGIRKQKQRQYELGMYTDEAEHAHAFTFKHAMSEYLEFAESEVTTVDEYERDLKKLWLPKFANRPLDSIEQFEVKKVISSWKKKDGTKYSYSEKRNRLIPCNQVFKHFDINPNPCVGIKIGKSQKDSVDRFDDIEREKIIHASVRHSYARKGDFQLMQVIGLACGLRCGEVYGLRKESFDLLDNQLHTDKAVTQKGVQTLKNLKNRWVYIPSWAIPLIRAYIQNLNENEFLFVNTEGSPIKDRTPIYGRHKKVLKECNIPLQRAGYAERDMYTNRHTRAAELLSIGTAPAEAASQLGHSTECFLRVYSEWIDKYSGKNNKSHLEGVPVKNIGLKLVK